AYVGLHQAEYEKFFSLTGVKERQSKNEPWPCFAKNRLPSGVLLQHKPSKGSVDLTFEKTTRDALFTKLAHLLDDRRSMGIVKASSSAALRYTVPKLVPTEPFSSQETAVRAAFTTVRSVLALWPSISASMGYATDVANGRPERT